ncbi:hypothetical protein IV102_36330 [bacterium]|nr:hypothetical protein [bacterium]
MRSRPRWLILTLLLVAAPLWTENLSISHIRYPGRLLFSKGCIYISVNAIADQMDMKLLRGGFGYWAGYSPPDELPSVPRGQVMVGNIVVPMIKPLDSKEYFVSAEAFCVGLGGKAEWNASGDLSLLRPQRPQPKQRPVELPEVSSPKIPVAATSKNPEDFFVTQYKSAANPDGNQTNGNCGPTTLAMLALAYHTLPAGIQASNRQGLILWCREIMTGNSLDQEAGSNLIQMRKAAFELGLRSQWVDDLDDLDWELRKGRLVAVSGDVNKIGFKVDGNGGHALLAIEKHPDYYVINDPGGFYRTAGSHMSVPQMRQFFRLGASFQRWPLSTSDQTRRGPSTNPTHSLLRSSCESGAPEIALPGLFNSVVAGIEFRR